MKSKIIVNLIFLCFMLKAANLVPGTKIYKKPNFKAKVVQVLKKSLKTKLRKTKLPHWFSLIFEGKRAYVYLNGSSSGSSSGTSSTNKAGRGSANKRAFSSGTKSGNAPSGRGNSRFAGSGSGSSSGNYNRGATRGRAALGASGASSSGSFKQKRKLTKDERLKEEHDKAKQIAEANNKQFCSQCWYAKQGADWKRFEDTHPKIEGGVLVTDGAESEDDGKEVVE